jgi:hypothetical protein
MRVVPDLSRRTRGVGALMYGWGQSFSWAALAVAWLLTFAIGIAIYFLPVARLLDSLTWSSRADGRLCRGESFPLAKESPPSMQLCSLVQRRWGDSMVEILKFSRETAFTPETIQILAAALDEAWERLRQSGSRLARPAYSRAMREVVAKRIIEMAQRGVEDREALVTDALRFIAANYEQPSKLTS